MDNTISSEKLSAARIYAPPHSGPSRVSRRLLPGLALALGDVLVLQACAFIALIARRALEPWLPISLTPENYVGVFAGVLIIPAMAFALRLYPGYGIAAPEKLRRQLLIVALGFSSLIVWDAIVQDGTWSRGILLITWAAATLLLPFCHSLLMKGLIRFKIWGVPLLVMGPKADARVMVESLKARPALGFVPVGYLSNDEPTSLTESPSVPFLGTSWEANRYNRIADTILILRAGRLRATSKEFIRDLAFANVILVPRSISGQAIWVTACDLADTSGLAIKQNLLVPHNAFIKRFFDCLLVVPVFVFSLPILAVAALSIVAISPGTPFYGQVREGRNGKQFKMLKLRTMVMNAERRVNPDLPANAPAGGERRTHLKLRQDPRVLPVIGSFLRKSSIDELPQLLNVLKGDMSLVGPRPLPHYHLASFGPPFRELRRQVMPGLSGLWQVEARSDSNLVIQEKLDSHYIRNWSLWLDLYVLTRTLSAVISGRGAR